LTLGFAQKYTRVECLLTEADEVQDHDTAGEDLHRIDSDHEHCVHVFLGGRFRNPQELEDVGYESNPH
jgi:hypothetical protein